ncbi:MAG: TIGR03936 family radical SAM-associated protein, partial [Desulfovibrionales bacterium]
GQEPSATTQVTRRVAPDLNRIDYPTRQVVPFGKVVHDRYSLEIARGCTRGCRFCHAGMVYRPVRERGLPVLDALLCRGLDQTGFEEVSFLSLSTGDYSTLEGLFGQSLDRCRAEQISISLPSLRVGSLNPRLMAMISGIRRTGATLAPEAGSQRLRDVINKGITEEELLDHTGSLFRLGWNGVKLYFMIGLPTEREEDLRAIQELCLKVLTTAGKKSRRLQVTASISPFVPKPHTPFQWEEQLSLDQVRSRLALLKRLFAPHRRLALRWQEPEMSFVEGVFARGDRALAPVIERAYGQGDILTAWAEHFSLTRWMTAFEMEGVDPRAYHRARDPEGPLPWDHIDAGISRGFLLRERGRALSGKATQDCRYGRCGQCGACDTKKVEAPDGGEGPLTVMPRLNQAFRDQTGQGAGEQEPGRERLDTKADHLRLWYAKTGPAAYLSQLELQRIFERAFRRAKMAMTFSSGFHPLPLISFGRALPVGVGSLEEWLNIYLREESDPAGLLPAINAQLPGGLVLERIERLGMGRRQPQAVAEDFCLTYRRPGSSGLAAWEGAMQLEHLWIDRETRKGLRRKDVRSFLKEVSTIDQQRVGLRLAWEPDYLSPLVIVRSVDQQSSLKDFHLVRSSSGWRARSRAVWSGSWVGRGWWNQRDLALHRAGCYFQRESKKAELRVT